MWSLISGPDNLTVNQYTGEVRWSRAQAGNHSIIVQIENQVNSTQVEWTLEVIPGYNASLISISQAILPYPQPVTLTGHVEYSSNNLVEGYLGGIVPVQVDIINNGSTRTINTFTNPTRNFSVTFYPYINGIWYVLCWSTASKFNAVIISSGIWNSWNEIHPSSNHTEWGRNKSV